MAKITVAKGDRIGPEIMDTKFANILAVEAKIEIEEIEFDVKVYLAVITSEIASESRETISRIKIFRKTPITKPYKN